MKKLQSNKVQSNSIKIGITVILLAIFVAFLYVLNQPVEGEAFTAASKLIFARAHVTEVESENAFPDTWTEDLRLGTQNIYVELDSGEFKGEELAVINYLSAYANIDLKEGSRIIVRLDYDAQGNPYVASVSNYDRGGVLIGLTSVFVGLLVILGGKKGVAAVVGLFFTVICIWFFLIPLLQRGFPTIPAAIILVAITTAVSLLLLNGFSLKTFCAVSGCIGGVAIAGMAAGMAGILTPINGFNMAEAEDLVLRTGDTGFKISGLLISGILISSLGAVMDVALTITSAVFELHAMNPTANRKRLFQSGINIGRDAMGTMANTLILAFAGSSLNILILFRIFGYPNLQIFNSDMMSIELIQGLAGSIGIVMTVPLVAALSAAICEKESKKN